MWFCAKKNKIGKGNLHLTKKQLGRNKICHTEDNHTYMSNMHMTMCRNTPTIMSGILFLNFASCELFAYVCLSQQSYLNQLFAAIHMTKYRNTLTITLNLEVVSCQVEKK